ncbi:2-hydroxyacylsphingosine 1-beta-galactosyltransferase-like [Ptychodera flava]|uniref:2-hydroxyacylsphingosine 1-beta-galactosyltransferase-like n=1 Tax=Ptychodera flava TaxID=63121 RepID=UPI003969CCE8
MYALTAHDQITFFDRLTNSVQCALSPLAKKLMYWHFDSLNIKYSVRPESSVAEMFAEMELILWNRDFTFEFQQPIMPHVILYGSITTKPASPLERDLESFMQNAENGVAIVSFGTFVEQLKGETLGRLPDVIAKALSRLPLKVICRFKGAKTRSLGNNTKIMEWLPLNDLLGHPKTRVFINQAGIMGIYEAIYHGVPMVAVPFFGDQLSNAARVKAKGMGPVLHASDVTEDKLYQSVMEVLTNGRYKLNMERYSKKTSQ